MVPSITDAISGINFIRGVVDKVKDNNEELRRLSIRLQCLLLALEESRTRDVLNSSEYEDALTTVTSLVERSQRLTQRMLKRSLGDRTWRRDEISSEIKRISNDVDMFLNVHTIKIMDIHYASNTQTLGSLSVSVEEIMVKLAEIDIRLRTPAHDSGEQWSPHVLEQAQTNVVSSHDASTSVEGLRQSLKDTPNDILSALPDPRALVASSRTSIRVSGLRALSGPQAGAVIMSPVTIPDTSSKPFDELVTNHQLIWLVKKLECVVQPTKTNTMGGNQVDSKSLRKSTPMIKWFAKYQSYHGLAKATTSGHTITSLADPDGKGYHNTIAVRLPGDSELSRASVEVSFHRTLRVPDNLDANRLPVNFGHFPLVPVARFANKLPENIRKRGGFFTPMFEREGLYISFASGRSESWTPAVKISAGGVNVLTGKFKNVHDAEIREQDYIVPGLQDWIDGAMTEDGVVRQFVAMHHGSGYTIEEQVTGTAEEGGFQFDIFPRYALPTEGQKCTFFELNMELETSRGQARLGRELGTLNTPDEEDVAVGAMLGMYDRRFWPIRVRHNWSVGAHYRRIGSLSFQATYFQRTTGGINDEWIRLGGPNRIDASDITSSNSLVSPMGIGLGGKIHQKIYRDPASCRVYDEESGHRFHVHILSPEAWEMVTGVVPPITPITPDTYRRANIPWFQLQDGHLPSLSQKSSNVLSQVKSILEIDQTNSKSHEQDLNGDADELIDPDRPPRCAVHASITSTVVFRPCGHCGCSTCFGSAMLRKSSCPKCKETVTKFVGIKDPVIGMEPETVVAADEGNELSWSVTEIEELATDAVSQGRVAVIHLNDDAVSPLVGKKGWSGSRGKKPQKSLEVVTLPNVNSSDTNVFSLVTHSPFSPSFTIKVLPSTTVLDIKNVLFEKFGIPPKVCELKVSSKGPKSLIPPSRNTLEVSLAELDLEHEDDLYFALGSKHKSRLPSRPNQSNGGDLPGPSMTTKSITIKDCRSSAAQVHTFPLPVSTSTTILDIKYAIYDAREDNTFLSARLTSADVSTSRNVKPHLQVSAKIAICGSKMLVEHPSAKMRCHAIACLSYFVPLAPDNDPSVRHHVCQTLVLLLAAHAEMLMSEMVNVAEHMLYSTKDKDENVALDACEFWLTSAEDTDLAGHLHPLHGKVALDCMIYDEDDLLWLEHDAEDAGRPQARRERRHRQSRQAPETRIGAYGEETIHSDEEDDYDLDDENFTDEMSTECTNPRPFLRKYNPQASSILGNFRKAKHDIFKFRRLSRSTFLSARLTSADVSTSRNVKPHLQVSAKIAICGSKMLVEHPSAKMRCHAIACLSYFVPLAPDNDPSVRHHVCQTLVLLLAAHAEMLMSEMVNVAEHMLYSTKDKDENVALDACEFWLTSAEDTDLAGHLHPLHGKVALDCMIYDEDDLLWLEHDAEDAGRRAGQGH
ncbi:hypothetical protein B0H16DRAFT_1717325 [Mycena metata]|uniref:RING-type domain-containing protein n=1 Tax=Mycena metata TaxID=1033252 RepID=A0AAD7NM83_9AGAR|nr:hypothetical protein B0H16DRAFT_1717325 [Mycena metata]